MSGAYAGVDPCTHCGFCLPACPTYLATGDEVVSPRGRIVLLRALEAGELRVTDAALHEHLASCTLCLACEPVCPSGVRFGEAYAAAQHELAAHGITLIPDLAH